MVVKFFSNSKGGTVGAVNYLLDKREKMGTAKVLKGDPELTKSIIKSIDFKQKITVGVLSFEEKNISEEKKIEIMEDFEKTLMPGMTDNLNILWVEHTDKGRLELNFVIPKVDLESGKSFNPYYFKADQSRIDMWNQKVNLENNYTNPKDPKKERTISTNKNRLDNLDYIELDKSLHLLVGDGKIKSRDEMIELLEESNIKITRKNKDGISIKLPNSKKAKRFKKGIYNEQFTSIREIENISNRAEQRIEKYNNRDLSQELKDIKQRLSEFVSRKLDENTKRISKKNINKIIDNPNNDGAFLHSNLDNDVPMANPREIKVPAGGESVSANTEIKDNREWAVGLYRNLQKGELVNDSIRNPVIGATEDSRNERDRDFSKRKESAGEIFEQFEVSYQKLRISSQADTNRRAETASEALRSSEDDSISEYVRKDEQSSFAERFRAIVKSYSNKIIEKLQEKLERIKKTEQKESESDSSYELSL